MTTDTETIIQAMLVLVEEIESPDGVANVAIAEAANRLEDQERTIQYERDAVAEMLGCDPDAEAVQKRIQELRDAELIAWAALHIDMRRIPGVLMTGETHMVRDHKNGGWFEFNARYLTNEARALIRAAMETDNAR